MIDFATLNALAAQAGPKSLYDYLPETPIPWRCQECGKVFRKGAGAIYHRTSGYWVISHGKGCAKGLRFCGYSFGFHHVRTVGDLLDFADHIHESKGSSFTRNWEWVERWALRCLRD